MIPYADLIGRKYSRDGLDPAGPLSCTGVVLALLARHGIPGPPEGGCPQDALGGPRSDAADRRSDCPSVPHDCPPATATEAAESVLATWASAESGPWETLPPEASLRPLEGDVLLLEAESDPAGLAVVVDRVRALAATSLPGRGVCALRLRALRPRILRVYRWRGAA